MIKSDWASQQPPAVGTAAVDERAAGEDHRDRLFAQILLGLALNVVLLIVVFFAFIPASGESRLLGGILLFGVLAVVTGTRALFLRFGARDLHVNLLLGVLGCALFGASFNLGGVMSPTMIFMLALPVLAATLVRPRWAVLWTVLTILAWLAMLLLEWRGTEIRQVTPTANLGPVQFVSLMGILLVIMGVLTSYLAANSNLRSTMEIRTRRLDHLASHDPLTNIPNRRSFFEEAQRCLNRANRLSRPFALLAIDINEFKSVNDTFGHAIGDAVLKDLARRMQQGFRKTDFISRIGGDEFGVLLESVDSKPGIEAAVSRFLAVAAIALSVDGRDVEYQVSIGAAMYTSAEDSVDALYETADSAMYDSKQQGIELSFDTGSQPANSS